MNIHDFYPVNLEEKVAANSIAAWRHFLERREVRFAAYLNVEGRRGFLKVPTSLTTSEGQEMVRILFARAIEELLEAREAQTPSHRREELIDSLNYFLSISLLEGSIFPGVTEALWRGWAFNAVEPTLNQPPFDQFLSHVLSDIFPFLDKLRNRAWQRNAQSLYFDGWSNLLAFYAGLSDGLKPFFGTWTSFAKFYIAKDEVLKFRLDFLKFFGDRLFFFFINVFYFRTGLCFEVLVKVN